MANIEQVDNYGTHAHKEFAPMVNGSPIEFSVSFSTQRINEYHEIDDSDIIIPMYQKNSQTFSSLTWDN